MLDEDIIQPNNSPRPSPILLVAKKSDPSDQSGKLSWRFCLDYRSNNSVKKKDVYPLPRIDTSLGTLGEGILARWITGLGTFDYILEHRKGSLHSNADYLCRRPHRKCARTDCPDCTNEGLLVSNIFREDAKSSFFVAPLMAAPENINDPHASVQDLDVSIAVENHPNENMPCNRMAFWTEEKITEWQTSDPNIKKIMDLKSLFYNKPPNHYVEDTLYACRVFWSLWESFEIRNGFLYHRFNSEIGEEKLVLVAQKEMRDKIFCELHEKLTAGHMGRDKTLDSIKRRFYWSAM
ncbi:unnamed protein product [Mytilus coruscus]|uniref:Integrase zinc-binding domain-containing protein n=1 Tax=Mytilus coruscus TaxID=42192 RepID=A0A6J8B5Q1_MYTCO|nr:unnamed protein product [Mytilus coruscus]